MIVAALVLAVVTLVVGIAAALVLRMLPSVRLQLAALAVLAVALPLVVVFTSGWVMFHMHDDVKLLAVFSVASALSALLGALLLARWIVQPLDRLRTTSVRLAAGDLEARAPHARQRELAQLGASFNEMAESVEQLFDARRQLVAWASHDLRTPLASLRAMVEALEDGLASPEHYLPAIREQVENLSRLVDDLFEVACIDAGVLTLELRDARLGDIVESCLRGVDAEARSRNIVLQARLDPADPVVRMAPDKVERVLSNLLANALRHTPSDGAVAVTVEPDSQHVVIAVEDTGEGLSPTAEDRMFERFWRGDDSRASVTGGAGLGLAIAQGLIQAQGGRIWAESRTAGGTRVAFTLPRATASHSEAVAG